MRIVVNDIAASSGGAMTVLKEFYRCVRDHDVENEWIFLLGDSYVEETDRIKAITLPEIKKSRFKKLRFDLFSGRRFISALKPDVVFSLQNIITFGLKVPQVVYLHQSIPFQSVKRFSFFRKKERKIAVVQYLIGSVIKASIRRADQVIVQTKWMKEIVSSRYNKNVINIAPTAPPIPATEGEVSFNPQTFFYPTSEESYKNNELLLQACKILDSENVDYSAALTLPQNEARRSDDRVKFVGRLPYEDVFKNYRRSALVFPSYVETFGFPLIEARSVGTIILASDCPFSHELLDDYPNAYFFDPFNARELASLMKKVVRREIVIKRIDSTSPLGAPYDSWQEVLNIICKNVKKL